MKKILSYILFALALALGIGGFYVASKPSTMPIATIIGAFAIPLLLLWWGLILFRSSESKAPSLSMNLDTPVVSASFFKRLNISYSALLITILIAATLILWLLFYKTDIDKCVEAGIKAEKSIADSDVWKKLEKEYLGGETTEKIEYRVRLQCMRAKYKSGVQN
jgi:hypothetical protein